MSGAPAFSLPRSSGKLREQPVVSRSVPLKAGPRSPSCFGKRVDPVGDGAGAKPDDEIAGLRDRGDGLDQARLVIDGQHLRVAVTAQAGGELVAVDAGNRRLTGRIDRRHQHDVGVVEAGRELVE